MFNFYISGALRTEKMELVAQMRKQQTRIHHLEAGFAQISKVVGIHVIIKW